MTLFFYKPLDGGRVYHKIEDAQQAPIAGDRVTFKFTTETETWNVASVRWNYGSMVPLEVAVYISVKGEGKI